MNNIQNQLFLLLIVAFSFPHFVCSQEQIVNELSYEVNRIYQPLSISKEELTQANTLVDLNKHFEAAWIKKYISVEILATQKGKVRKVVSENDALSPEQKEIMNTADVATEISVSIQYIPNNTLKHNDAKEMSFTFLVNPEIEAEYAGGQQELIQYLKDNAIDKIADGSFVGLDLAAVKFTIDEKGEITNAHVFETSKDEKIDELLLEALRNMPLWKPAQYANGLKVKQEFVLTVGNMESCVINLLHIRRG